MQTGSPTLSVSIKLHGRSFAVLTNNADPNDKSYDHVTGKGSLAVEFAGVSHDLGTAYIDI